MNLRDALDVKVGSTPVNKIYKGTYKVWDRNKIALEGYCKQETTKGKNYCPTDVSQWKVGQYNMEGDIDDTSSGALTRIRLKELLSIPQNAILYFNTFSSQYNFVVRLYDKNKQFMRSYGAVQNEEIIDTTNKEIEYLSITIYNPMGAVTGQEILDKIQSGEIKPFICLNSEEDKSFEKYTGRQPSPNPDYPQEIEVMQGRQVVPIEKNRFDKNNANIIDNAYIYQAGATVVNSNGNKTLYIPCKPNTTYTVQKVLSSRFSVGTFLQEPTIGTTINKCVRDYGATELSITTGTNDTYLGVWYYRQASDTTITEQEILDSLQIMENSEYTVDLKSKNVLDLKDMTGSRTLNGIEFVNNGDSTFNVSGTATMNISITIKNVTEIVKKLKKDTNYYFYCSQGYNVNTFNISLAVSYIDNSTVTYFTPERPNKINKDLTIKQALINFWIPNGATVDTAVNVKTMFVESDIVDNDYEPYYDYKLAGIGDYKDNFYTDKGKWYFKQNIGNVVLDGSETWAGGQQATVSTDYTYVYSAAIDNLVKSQYYIAFCNKLKSLNRDMLITTSVSTDTISVGSTSYQKIRIMVLSSRLAMSSVASFKNWLSENNIELYYVLNTPAIEEITAPTLINQLNALYQAM